MREKKTGQKLEKRLQFFTIGIFLIFALLVVRLGYLQLVQGEEYEKLAAGNRIRLLPLEAPRGEFLDRNGRVLVANRLAPTISVVPMDLEEQEDPQAVLERLGELLGYDVVQSYYDTIAKKKARQEFRLYEPIRVATDVDIEVLTVIEEHLMELPGVVIEEQPVREYVLGDIGSHIFGYVREISREELDAWRDLGYRMGDLVGKTGLERVFDQTLRGEKGNRRVEVDAVGHPIRDQGKKAPVQGNSLQLTIDSRIQLAATQALRKSMEELRTRAHNPMPNAKAGAAVVLDVNSGAVLAMVSEPGFDPNIFVKENISEEEWQELNDPVLKPQLNRVLRGEYPSGSTFKMITAIAGLEKGVIKPEDTIRCTGFYWRVEPKRCWNWNRGGHGPVSLKRAIAQSCNVYFYDLGYRTGIDTLTEYAAMFGLGKPTGIELHPGEKGGFLATSQWRLEHFGEPWQPGETLSAAIGQGFSTYTPLQMANYVAMIANGGIRYRPYLVQKIISPSGEVLEVIEPEIMGRANVSPETFAAVREGMRAVTEPGGTAYSHFADFPIPVAGKTGTAENPQGEDHGWFVGFAPADDPQVALAVLVEQGGGGSGAAAPVAREIFAAIFLAPGEDPVSTEAGE
ncbi:MAG: penicillin-binding protein 2 [bacterium]|nr:penicillin-binding protein 2 [Bacillota bacterium]HHW54795.1 penicillin-binding protein 2 [Bacillota bacterium]